MHIHDGEVHAEADFDHVLYCQPREGEPLKFDSGYDWQESKWLAGSFVKVIRAKLMVETQQHCYRQSLMGSLPNRDTFVALES